MDGVKRLNVSYENEWDYTYIHIDIPIPYEENYQVSMLKNNALSGFLNMRAGGRDGQSRYTYRVHGGISLEKRYADDEIGKQEIERFTEELLDAVAEVKNHLLNPDGILLFPELIFVVGGHYRFCYLPVPEQYREKTLCRSFHEMTEYFVKKLDYHDMDSIFFVCKMHKETMGEQYDLKRIMEESREERKSVEEEYRSEREENIPDSVLFSVDQEDSVIGKTKYKRTQDVEKIAEKSSSYSPIKHAINRIKTGRWGEWEDMITEMDGQKPGRPI